MFQNRSLLAAGVVCLAVLIGSCKKDEGQPTGSSTPQGPLLTATPAGVTVQTNRLQNVTITGGVRPYSIFQQPNVSLATAQFVNANLDTVVLVITGVSTATGSTSVLVRDASSPQQKSVAVGILKVQ
jgi:hypothetical protein